MAGTPGWGAAIPPAVCHARGVSVIRSIGTAERRARLSVRHRLVPSRRTDDVPAIVDDLVGLHSSDPVTVYLSAAARMAHPSFTAVESALYEDRTLLRHHAMRRTLWVFTHRVARLAHASTSLALLGPEERRFIKLIEGTGVTTDGMAWLDAARRDVLAALESSGPTTARHLGDAVPALKVPIEMAVGKSYAGTQSAHTRVLLLLGFEGAIVRARPVGSWINGQYRWATMTSWVPGGIDGAEPGRSGGRTGGPVAAGLRAGDDGRRAVVDGLDARGHEAGVGARRRIGGRSRRHAGLGRRGRCRLGRQRRALGGAAPWARSDHDGLEGARLVPRPCAHRPAVRSQRQRRADGLGGRAGRRRLGAAQGRAIAYELLADVGTEAISAIEGAAHDLERLLGDTRFTVRFPAPIQAELLR